MRLWHCLPVWIHLHPSSLDRSGHDFWKICFGLLRLVVVNLEVSDADVAPHFDGGSLKLLAVGVWLRLLVK